MTSAKEFGAKMHASHNPLHTALSEKCLVIYFPLHFHVVIIKYHKALRLTLLISLIEKNLGKIDPISQLIIRSFEMKVKTEEIRLMLTVKSLQAKSFICIMTH